MGDKILITGSGLCGTTWLWGLMKELGYTTEPTGIETPTYELMRNKTLVGQIEDGRREWPDVIKHLGGFSLNLNEHVDRHGWKVKHIFLILRRLDKSVGRRVSAPRHLTHKSLGVPFEDYKKMSKDEKGARMREILINGAGSAIFNFIERDHDFTVVRYPKAAVDPTYCYQKVRPVLPIHMQFDAFQEAWNRSIRRGNGVRPRHFEEEGIKPPKDIVKWWEENETRD